jgi:small subunit ribosomal protein S4
MVMPGKKPGGRGGRRNRSRYGTQMDEKQNLKEIYGIRERQLKKYYREAKISAKETGPEMIKLLEQRLDNAIYRAGFASTRNQARQMASHGLFQVNGRTVTIPSLRVRTGDNVSIKESKRKKAHFSNFEMRMQNAQLPEWLQLEVKGFGFKVINDPQAKEANIGVAVKDVVEFLGR